MNAPAISPRPATNDGPSGTQPHAGRLCGDDPVESSSAGQCATAESGGGSSLPGRHGCPWTPAEDRRLEMIWGEVSLRVAARRLGRTEEAVYARAGEIGLPRGLQPGTESLKQAADRCGYSCRTMRAILERHGVKAQRRMSLLGRTKNPAFRPTQWDPDEVDNAVIAWLAHEVMGEAARKRGITKAALRRWLIAAGETPPARREIWRLPTGVIDRAIELHHATETLRQASLRIGISEETLRRHFKAAGIARTGHRRMPWRVSRAVVDQVVAALPPETKARIAAQRAARTEGASA